MGNASSILIALNKINEAGLKRAKLVCMHFVIPFLIDFIPNPLIITAH